MWGALQLILKNCFAARYAYFSNDLCYLGTILLANIIYVSPLPCPVRNYSYKLTSTFPDFAIRNRNHNFNFSGAVRNRN